VKSGFLKLFEKITSSCEAGKSCFEQNKELCMVKRG
jgi:hypothetical protein